MSWLDALSDIAQATSNFRSFSDTLVAKAKSQQALNATTNTVVSAGEEPKKEPLDPTKVDLDFSIENKIPVLYGRGLTSGVLLDAVQDDGGLDLWVVYGISEVTGTTISGAASRHYLKRVFINNYEANFQANGVTVESIEDENGNQDVDINNLVEVYYFYDGGLNQDFPEDYSGTAGTVQDVVPGYGEFHRFYKMVFAVVKYTYSEEKDFTRLPTISFDVENTLVQPGDVLYDFMTNKRYGAGIPQAEIFIE